MLGSNHQNNEKHTEQHYGTYLWFDIGWLTESVKLDYWLHNRYLRLCLHAEVSSFLLLRLANFGWQIMKYFSRRHRLHFLEQGEYAWLLAIIFHLTSYCLLLSLSFQMCWLRVVAVLLLGFRKLLLCPLYLVLKALSTVICFFLSCVVCHCGRVDDTFCQAFSFQGAWGRVADS